MDENLDFDITDIKFRHTANIYLDCSVIVFDEQTHIIKSDEICVFACCFVTHLEFRDSSICIWSEIRIIQIHILIS